VLARGDHEGAILGQQALAVAHGVFDQRRRAQIGEDLSLAVP
jgi:hypothetical protein